MTRKPTKRKANRLLDDLEDDVGGGGDVEVNIRTWGVDRAENVDDVDTDEGIVITGGGMCGVGGCDEAAIGPEVDRCASHYDGGDGD